MSQADRQHKLRELQDRQRKSSRRPVLIAVAAAIIAIAVALAIALWPNGSTQSTPVADPALNVADQIIPADPAGATTTQATPAKVTNPSGIDGVIAYDTSGYPAAGTPTSGTLQHDHVLGPVSYTITPPVGGPHNPVWMNAGVYTKPIPSERAVHNLEHGAVWITYRPDLPAAQVDQLVAFVGKQSLIDESAATQIPGQRSRYLDLSPWSTNALPAPIVISSWGYQLQVDSPTDPRLQRFVDTFRHSEKYSPEFDEPVDGVPVQTGGRPAAYGATQPNPAGAVSQ